MGQLTNLKDSNNNLLFVGDTVQVTNLKGYLKSFEALVVSDEFTSYIDGSEVVKEGEIEYYIMGIKDQSQDFKEWEIEKIDNYWNLKSRKNYTEFKLRIKMK